MSIDDYNRHATLGSLAGPPTNASQLAGQQAYDNAHRQIPHSGAPVRFSGTHGQIPKFLRVGALRRGLWTMGVSTLLSVANALLVRPGTVVYDAVSTLSIIAFVFGFFLVVCGVIAKVAGRRKPEATLTQADAPPSATADGPGKG